MGYRLRIWDERTLQRLAAAWRDGVTPRELAERFGYTERAMAWRRHARLPARFWLGAGRNGCAFERLSWRTAQRIVDETRIWAGITAVAQAVLAQPVEAGERALSGECVQVIMRGAGIEPGALRQSFFARCFTPMCCPPERRRKVSRRFAHSLSWWAMLGATSSAAANCGNEIEIATYAGP